MMASTKGTALLATIDRHGTPRLVKNFSSAEALAQSLPAGSAIQSEEMSFWMYDAQRLEKLEDFERLPPRARRLKKLEHIERLPPGARAALAVQSNSEEDLILLSRDPDLYVRWRVADNHSTPQYVREALAQKDGLVAGSLDEIARDMSTPADTLIILASDPYSNVRYWVANNANTPVATLLTLATDPQWNVRAVVAENASTPKATLNKLATDPTSIVQKAAKENLAKRSKTS